MVSSPTFRAYMAMIFIAAIQLLVICKRRRSYTKKERAYFLQVESGIGASKIAASARANVWGKEITLTSATKEIGTCLIPSPKLLGGDGAERFRSFISSLRSAASFLPLVDFSRNGPLYLVQKLQCSENSCSFKLLALPDKEALLKKVASALRALHSQYTEEGDALFHGFLVPRNIFVLSEGGFFLAYAGLVFAAGAKNVSEALQRVKSGNAPVDISEERAIIEDLPYLAPEIISGRPSIGPAADIYSFAAIAALCFTEEPFSCLDNLNWRVVPDHWHLFLKEALQASPAMRPASFDELESYLEQPEVAFPESFDVIEDSENSAIEEIIGKAFLRVEGKQESKKFLIQGRDALKHSKWDHACSLFKKVVILSPDLVEAHALLAIAYFEKGEMEECQKHFRQFIDRDPSSATTFRKHIFLRA